MDNGRINHSKGEKSFTSESPARRHFIGNTALLAAAASMGVAGLRWPTLSAFGQDPPTCPSPPTGGTPFSPGQDKRPIVGRKPIRLLSVGERSNLRKAFEALRALPVSDPRSWLQQADLHALFCNQCSGFTAQIHGTWNFFPWHRAYLYYFERILGALIGKIDTFRLPYWDWETQRELPQPYIYPVGITNSLWDGLRDSNMATTNAPLPPNDGTSARITLLNSVPDFAIFGGDAGNPGACESDPHNIIHTDIGKENPPGIIPHKGKDMGLLGYAARDPIFFSHHGNIDRLWSNWNSLAGGAGLPPDAYTNPTDAAFVNARWSFYDENKNIVSISAGDVLDHENNLRYTYQSSALRILKYHVIRVRVLCCDPDPERGSKLEISEDARREVLEATRSQRQVHLVLRGVEVGPEVLGNFGVYAIRAQRRMRIGQFGQLSELQSATKAQHKMHKITLLLDVTKAVEDLFAKEKPAELRAISVDGKMGFAIKAEDAELRVATPRK